MSNIEKILEIMAALRDTEHGCPWDLAQDFASIAPYTVEEAYEVADAIERRDWSALRDELGDLLFQVVFHARLAEEAGRFDFPQVVEAICAKMIRRHPHVFGDATRADAAGVRRAWEAQKAEERGPERSAVDGVALALPALLRAGKLGKRASTVGFDWPDSRGVYAKIDEEMAELKASEAQNPARVAEELGDLLFTVANLARHLGVEPEAALAAANRKFERRFRAVEERTGGGTGTSSADPARLEAAWEAVKAAEKG